MASQIPMAVPSAITNGFPNLMNGILSTGESPEKRLRLEGSRVGKQLEFLYICCQKKIRAQAQHPAMLADICRVLEGLGPFSITILILIIP